MNRQQMIRCDYKTDRCKTKPGHSYRYHHWLVLAGIILGIALVLGAAPNAAKENKKDKVAQLEAAKNIAIPSRVSYVLPLPKAGIPVNPATETYSAPPGKWRIATVRPGDNLSLIFNRHHLSPRQLQNILSLGPETAALHHLYPGDTLRLQIEKKQQLQNLVYKIDENRTLKINWNGNAFQAQVLNHPPTKRINYATATIRNSLFLAAQRAGLSDNITMQLAAIFGWDVDFALDIRSGDNFSVVYEELYLNGEKLRDGNIIAAEFHNRGQSYRAIRYTPPHGRTEYYSPDGKNMRKTFLRTPVAFTRISSRFSLGRKHPILHHIRAHKGVDYAAPRGTPIKATGDGKVVFRGRKGGYGNTIVIQHGGRYSTLYAHMSRFARGMRNGRRIRQGQTIGYVGSTGLATGPHLHYEFRIHGVHHNPLTVALPAAAPLAHKYFRHFRATTAPYLAQLDLLKRTLLATKQGE